jgi:Na+-translocating ferredoxin:NAD+ oxidoreductase RnfG subunit
MLPRHALMPAALLGAALVPGIVHAVEYLSVQQAQALMFADATAFTPVFVSLKPEQLAQLAQRAGGPARMGAWRVWQARRDDTLLGYVVTDAVIGKFELIDYAVALSPTGEIRDVEVLAYRESHGQEVRGQAWRAQFAGKSASAPLRVGEDVQNISGATLSCTHLTDGIHRIAAMIQLIH